jgi:surface antigen
VSSCEGLRLAALAAALSLTGCSMPIKGFVDAAPTGAIKSKTYPFADEDWAKAAPALSAAIRADASDDPAPWANADSGRRGTVAGIGARYDKGGATCRAFVAKIGDDRDTRIAQGAACLKADEVTISEAAPFKGL